MLPGRVIGGWVILALLVDSFTFHPSVGLMAQKSYLHNEHIMGRSVKGIHFGPWSEFSCSRMKVGESSEFHADVGKQINETRADDVYDSISPSDLDETQILLACRAYLSKKHKLTWRNKKVRREAAPLFNQGYFWNDPSELLYLKFDDNCSDSEEILNYAYNAHSTIRGGNSIEYSTNPFSTNPINPSDEHLCRSKSRAHLWSNQTWKEEWYEKRWKGRKLTDEERKRRKAKRRIENMPSKITSALSTPELALSEEEVVTATLNYIRTRQKMSDAKKQLKRKKLAQREEIRQWKAALKKRAEGLALQMKATNSTRSDITSRSIPLTFEPTAEAMVGLMSKRSMKAKRAYKKRLSNKPREYTKNEMELRHEYSRVEVGNDKAIQAILRINDALNDAQLPSVADVKAILLPGRLRQRRSILVRILAECFDLKGKCVPSIQNGKTQLNFAQQCTISDLGEFVLSKMNGSNMNGPSMN